MFEILMEDFFDRNRTYSRDQSKFFLYVCLCLAMQPHLSELTPEEQQRNQHRQMYLYSYTDKNLNMHEATSYFPQIISHAEVALISHDDIFVPKERLIRGLSPGFDLNIYYPGFPTLQYISHTASLVKSEVRLSLDFHVDPILSSLSSRIPLQVKVFQQVSRGENMILYITPKQTPSLENLASQLLGKSVYVNWPYLKEALVTGVANCNTKFTLIDPLVGYNQDNVNKENIKGLSVAEWNMQMKHISET